MPFGFGLPNVSIMKWRSGPATLMVLYSGFPSVSTRTSTGIRNVSRSWFTFPTTLNPFFVRYTMYSSLKSGMPVEFTHCEKNATRFSDGWPAVGSSRRLARFGQFLEIVEGGGLASVLRVKILEQRTERRVAECVVQHVEHHRAFIFDDRAIVIRIRLQPLRLRNRRGVFVHQRADREIVERLAQSRLRRRISSA